LLAAIFRLTGPGIFAARFLPAFAGLATAILLGLLAARLTTQRALGLWVAVSALLTPWLFELSRLLMEPALYPLALALFLLCLHRSATRLRWGWLDVIGLAATLALLTYTYSIGRLLGPLLAFGLIIFARRVRLRSLILTWVSYGLTLIPLVAFQRKHPAALTARFWWLSYVKAENTLSRIAWNFVKHYLGNLNPWRLFVTEHSKVSEVLHAPGAPPLLAVTGLLVLAGIVTWMRPRKFDAWWLFVVYGLLVSVIPASLTKDYFHMLRLSALPVFLIVLSIPGLEWLFSLRGRNKRILLVASLVLMFGQALIFQWQYRASAGSPQRLHVFEADYPTLIFPTALGAASSQPVYLADSSARPGYVQAYWYAALRGVPREKFIFLDPDKAAPEGGVVITTEGNCTRCRILATSGPYTVYLALGPRTVLTALADKDFRAELNVPNPPVRLKAGEQATIKVLLKNASNALWPVRERDASAFQLSLGNHWLGPDGKVVVNDDGRGPLPYDLRPGETVEIFLIVNAPLRPGDYVLEIDMLQEGVSWFGLKGSRTWRGNLAVVDE
jgi:4-amino-4-deoxy-L-arabinose transferase-like glycosyltransferase